MTGERSGKDFDAHGIEEFVTDCVIVLGGGLFRGSIALVTGTTGTGKTSIGAYQVNAACERGERVLLVVYEESTEQVLRNMRSLGLDLRQWIDAGLLRIWTSRPSAFGLETHLAVLTQMVEEQNPSVAVLDGIAGLAHVGSVEEVTSIVGRKFDMLRSRGVTTMATVLGEGDEPHVANLSSMVDTWLQLRTVETDGERNRLLSVLKSRGMAHSNQVRDLLENPQLAADDQILAVPTVVKKLPAPMRKLVGDLSDTARLLVGLELRPSGRAKE